jgi:SagB-type dehydrogenase family enzyme
MKQPNRLRNDINALVSILLLLVTVLAVATGVIADLWDLNDFVYHTYAGYALALLALAHVGLQWGRLVAYVRMRIATLRRASPPSSAGADRPKPHAQAQGTQRSGQEGIFPHSHQPEAADADGDEQQQTIPQAQPAQQSPFLTRRDVAGLLLGGIGFALGRGLRPPQELPDQKHVGMLYHHWSKTGWQSIFGTISDWGKQPPLYKHYPQARKLTLPQVGDVQGLSTEEAIRQRRSVRDYGDQPLTMEQLSHLLFLSEGINAERWGHKLRSAPSAGALYPIETYVVAHRVAGLEAGLYHYSVKDHALHVLQTSDLRQTIVQHGLMQAFLGEANLVLVFSAIFQRLRWKYQERTYRYALIEVGHIGQNAYLAATSMGLGGCVVGAFHDDDVNKLLGVDGEQEAALMLMSVGVPQK